MPLNSLSIPQYLPWATNKPAPGQKPRLPSAHEPALPYLIGPRQEGLDGSGLRQPALGMPAPAIEPIQLAPQFQNTTAPMSPTINTSPAPAKQSTVRRPPQYPAYGGVSSLAQRLMQNQLGGLDTMSGLGDQIGNAAAYANGLSSQNLQAKYGPRSAVEVAKINAQRDRDLGSQGMDKLKFLLPLLQGVFGGQFSGGGMSGGFRTNYGAGFSAPQGGGFSGQVGGLGALGLLKKQLGGS